MDNLLVIGVFEAFVLAILLFLKKDRNLADVILSGYFLIFGVNILLSYIEYYNITYNYPLPFFINTTAPFVLLHGPLLLMYIQAQTTLNFKIKTIHALHLIPFLSMLIDHSFHFYFIPAQDRIEIAKSEVFTEYFTYPVFVLLIAFSPLVYFQIGIFKLKRYNLDIKNKLSRIDVFDFRWLKRVLIFATIIYCCINIVFVIDLIYPVGSFRSLQFFAFLFASVFILILGLFGHKQHSLFDTPLLNVPEAIPHISSANSNTDLFLNKLKDYMLAEKPYLNSELTIFKLSRELLVSQEYLSGILNNCLHMNFYDFINSYRIEEFKERLNRKEYQNLTLISLALDCGFNSKATFNRVFKNLTGITPSQYKHGTIKNNTANQFIETLFP